MHLTIVICNISDNNFINLFLNQKLEIINNIISAQFNNKEFQESHETNERNISGIFVLPEYFFNPKTSYGAPIPLSLEEKIAIKKNFLDLPFIRGLLIIPGSFSYIREITQNKKESILHNRVEFESTELNLYNHKTQEKLKKNLDEELKDIDTLPKYIKNSSFCFFNKGYKKSSKRESVTDLSDEGIFIPGMKPPVIDCNGILVGISICRDTIEKYLDNYNRNVDLEIILSDWISWDQIKQDNSYNRTVIHASTKQEHTGVMDSQKNIINQSSQENNSGLLISTFDIDLNLAPVNSTTPKIT